MPRHFRLTALLILGAALLAPLPGCDRGDDVTPPIVVVTPEPVRAVIITAEFTNVYAGTWFGIPVDIEAQQPGVLDITVDWASDETWMYVYFGDTECGVEEVTGGTCPFMIASETKEPKPRVLFTDLLQPATYYLYLHTVPWTAELGIGSDFTEAVSLQLGLTIGFQPQAAGNEDESIQLGAPLVLSPPRL
jgi:hypothetical protein